MIKTLSSSRVYRSVTLLLVMVAVVGALIFILSKERSLIANQADTHATEDTRVADMIRIARYAREESSLVNDINIAFQSATDTVVVIEAFERVGKEAGVILDIGQAERVQLESGEQYLSILAQARGSWARVYGFVERLDTFPYEHQTVRIVFSKLSSDVGTVSEWEGGIEMRVKLTP
jgi:hypothetical protein